MSSAKTALTTSSSTNNNGQRILSESTFYRYGYLRIKEFMQSKFEFNFSIIDQKALFADWGRQIEEPLKNLKDLLSRVANSKTFIIWNRTFMSCLAKLQFDTLFVYKIDEWLLINY